MSKLEWFDWDADNEIHEVYRDRLLMRMPALNSGQLDVLRQCRKTIWDGNVASKSARDFLCGEELVTRWNGWQVITRKGMALLDVLGDMNDDRWGTSEERKVSK